MVSPEALTIIRNKKEADREKLRVLVKDGFGKELVHDYFDGFDPEAVYIMQSGHRYAGAIILLRTGFRAFYLDKIVVAKERQGNGIGLELWNEMLKHHKNVFWRAKPENPINRFYASVCDGMQKTDGWHIYWVGLTPAELKKAISYALAKKESFRL